jgi:hypothetical protein
MKKRYFYFIKIKSSMPTLDTQNFKLSIRDIVFIIMLVATVVSNYFIVTAGQDKVNAVTDLKLQYMSIQVGKLEIELEAMRNKPTNK